MSYSVDKLVHDLIKAGADQNVDVVIDTDDRLLKVVWPVTKRDGLIHLSVVEIPRRS